MTDSSDSSLHTTRPPRTHKNAAGVEFVTVKCPVCYFQHAHTAEAEAAAPDKKACPVCGLRMFSRG